MQLKNSLLFSLSKFIAIFTIFMTHQIAWAFYTVHDTGDLIKSEEMQIGAETQFVTSGDEGVNVAGRFDKGMDDESNIRVYAGAGTTDFFIGGLYKWVPFPDFEKQPAIGFSFGAQYAHYEDENDLALRFIPFVSKKFDTDLGELTPYASLPISFSNYDDDTELPVQITIGSRYRHPDFTYCDFSAELGFDANDSFTYIGLAAIFPAFE